MFVVVFAVVPRGSLRSRMFDVFANAQRNIRNGGSRETTPAATTADQSKSADAASWKSQALGIFATADDHFCGRAMICPPSDRLARTRISYVRSAEIAKKKENASKNAPTRGTLVTISRPQSRAVQVVCSQQQRSAASRRLVGVGKSNETRRQRCAPHEHRCTSRVSTRALCSWVRAPARRSATRR